MYSGELINNSITNLDDFDSRMGVVRITTKEKNPPKLPGVSKVVSFSGVKESHGMYKFNPNFLSKNCANGGIFLFLMETYQTLSVMLIEDLLYVYRYTLHSSEKIGFC